MACNLSFLVKSGRVLKVIGSHSDYTPDFIIDPVDVDAGLARMKILKKFLVWMTFLIGFSETSVHNSCQQSTHCSYL